VVEAFPGGALAAVIDGLGHGPGAARASARAAEALRRAPAIPVLDLVRRCHESLVGTRGAVLSLASFDAGSSSMTWTGVGNVQGELFRCDPAARPPREALLVHGGVLGARLPPLRSVRLPISVGDVLVLASDGVRSGFSDAVTLGSEVERIAQTVLRDHASRTDDALVLVVRWSGDA
jgi:hypothetical protein